MAWSTVKDWAAAETVTAAMMDTYISDNTQYLYDVRYGAGHRNVLVNPQMEIWQAGTSLAITSSATPQYLADQWCHRRNGATGATVSRQTGPTGQLYTLRVQRDSGNSNTTAIETMQPLETVESIKLAGQTCQLKLNLKAGANFSATSSLVTIKVTYGTGTDQAAPASTWTGTTDALSTTQAITTTATDYTFDSISIPSSATQVQVYVSFTPTGTASTNDWVEIAGAQLTAGKMATWERLPHAVQLQRCQRFFWAWGPMPSAGYGVVAMSMNASTTAAVTVIPLPTTMRITPTVTFSGNNDFRVVAAGAGYTVTSAAESGAGNKSAQAVQISWTTSGMTAGHAGYIDNFADQTNAALYVNARL